MEQLSFEITAELNKLTKGLDRASAKIESFAKRNEKRFKDFGQKAGKLGQQLSISLTAPLALLAAQSVRTFSTFDDQMRKVGVTAGATEEELKQLTDIAKELGRSTRFSAREAAQGLEFMALAGFTAEESIKAIPDVLNLAAASAIELGTASDIVTDTMSAFSISAEKAANVSDVLAKTQASANTTVLQLGEAFKFSTANAATFGQDLETLSSVLGIFADSGVKGSRAGTAFNAMIRDLKASADNGIISIANQNIALADSEGNFRDLVDIMSDVQRATDGLTQSQRSNALDAIFQEEAIRGVNILMTQGVDKVRNLREELYKSEGTALSFAEAMESGLGGSLRSLNAAFEGFSIELGQVLAPMVQKLSGYLQKLLNRFEQFSPTTKKIIVIVGAFVAALGPLLIVIGGIASALPALMTGFAAITGPIGLTVGAIALLIAGLISVRSEYAETGNKLSILSQIRSEALQSIAKEKSQVELLIAIAKDENFSKERRIEAIKELNQISPKYLGNLDLESVKTDKARIAIENYNKAVERRAIVKAAEIKLQELAEKKIQRELEYQQQLEKNKQAEIDLSKKSFDNAQAEEFQKRNLANANEINRLSIDAANKEYEKERDLILGIIKNNSDLETSIKSLSNTRNEASTQQPVNNLQSQGAIQGEQPNLIGQAIDPNLINQNFATVTQGFLDFSNNLNNLINGSIASTLSNLGTSIGEALANGTSVTQAIGQSLLQSMAQFLGQLGDMLIQYGLFAKAKGKLDLAIAAGGPASILAGAAAVGVGIALKAISGAIGSRAQSGFSGGGGTGADVGGGGVNNNFTQSFQSGTREIILKVRGRDLVAVLNNQTNFNNVLG